MLRDLRSRCKEEWPAYVSRCGSDLPRPILFFVAAKKNGFACRTSLPLGCIDSWFQSQTWESMQGFPRKRHPSCSDSWFEGVNLGITAGFHPETSSIVHRFLISGPDLGVDASFAGFLAARRGGFAQSLRSFAGSLAARRGGPCKDGIYQGVARPGGPLFRFVGSGLVKASFRRPGPPKRNQHRLCDADSLIISALRWVRDSNPRSDRSLTCFRGRLLQPLGQLTLDRQISYKFLKYQSCRGNAFNFSNLAIYFIQSLEELQFRKWWILINPKTFVS